MSVTPPSGFGIYARTAQPNGGAHTAVNTFGFKNNGGFAAAAASSALTSALSGTARPYNAGSFNSDWTQIKVYCLLNTGGVLTSATTVFSTAGTLSADSAAPGTSVVVHKDTGLAGRQYRGRLAYFACAVDELDINSNGIIDAGVVTAYQAFWTAAFNAAVANSVPLYLIHGPGPGGVTPVPTALTGLTMSNLVGSQRKRLRR